LRDSLRGKSSMPAYRASACCSRASSSRIGAGRTPYAVRPAPLQELVFAVLIAGGGLAPALQGPVVAFVETPGTARRDPASISRVERKTRGRDRTTQQRCVYDVGEDPRVGKLSSAVDRLCRARVGQCDVDPACEQAVRFPLALPVPQQDKSMGHLRADSSGAASRHCACQLADRDDDQCKKQTWESGRGTGDQISRAGHRADPRHGASPADGRGNVGLVRSTQWSSTRSNLPISSGSWPVTTHVLGIAAFDRSNS
jgi:hypothetical protein